MSEISRSVIGDPVKQLEKKVLDKQKCDRIKVLVKKLLSNVDERKHGYVKL